MVYFYLYCFGYVDFPQTYAIDSYEAENVYVSVYIFFTQLTNSSHRINQSGKIGFQLIRKQLLPRISNRTEKSEKTREATADFGDIKKSSHICWVFILFLLLILMILSNDCSEYIKGFIGFINQQFVRFNGYFHFICLCIKKSYFCFQNRNKYCNMLNIHISINNSNINK